MGTFWSVIGAAVLLGSVGALVWRAYRYTRWVRLIDQTPITKIADLAGGFAAVQGSVVALTEGLLEAPLSRRRCVAFSVYLLYNVGGEIADSVSDEQSLMFALDDGTGRVEINLAEFRSIFYRPAKSDLGGELWEASADIIDRATSHYRNRFPHENPTYFPKFTWYRETIVGEGDFVYALGPVSVSYGGSMQLTEPRGRRTILAIRGNQDLRDLQSQFRRSARRHWLASFLLPTVAVFAYVGVRAAGWI